MNFNLLSDLFILLLSNFNQRVKYLVARLFYWIKIYLFTYES